MHRVSRPPLDGARFLIQSCCVICIANTCAIIINGGSYCSGPVACAHGTGINLLGFRTCLIKLSCVIFIQPSDGYDGWARLLGWWRPALSRAPRPRRRSPAPKGRGFSRWLRRLGAPARLRGPRDRFERREARRDLRAR
jgi:hypothetical protein